jgi:rRNA maturation endonuclease Nob1
MQLEVLQPPQDAVVLHIKRCIHCGSLFETLNGAACDFCKRIWERQLPVSVLPTPEMDATR